MTHDVSPDSGHDNDSPFTIVAQLLCKQMATSAGKVKLGNRYEMDTFLPQPEDPPQTDVTRYRLTADRWAEEPRIDALRMAAQRQAEQEQLRLATEAKRRSGTLFKMRALFPSNICSQSHHALSPATRRLTGNLLSTCMQCNQHSSSLIMKTFAIPHPNGEGNGFPNGIPLRTTCTGFNTLSP